MQGQPGLAGLGPTEDQSQQLADAEAALATLLALQAAAQAVQAEPPAAPCLRSGAFQPPAGLSAPYIGQQAPGAHHSSPATAPAAAAVSKLAAAREKNRLAQQRFRERQRAKAKVAGEQCKVLQQEIDQLEAENAQLLQQSRIYAKVLAVRDAMLHTFTSLQPAAQQQQQPPQQHQQPGAEQAAAAAAEAACGLAQALDQLPTEREMDALASSSQPTSTAAQASDEGGGGAGSASAAAAGLPTPHTDRMESGDSSAAVPSSEQPLQLLLGEPHRTGTAGALDGDALGDIELIPPPSNEALRERILAMRGPEDLLEFVHGWQAGLKQVYEAAEAAGFDDGSVAAVEAHVDRMTEMWWHTGQLRPAYLSYLAHAALPENSSRLPLWREIAAEVLPHMDDDAIRVVRRSWHQYCKRLAKAAVGVSSWVRKLQQYAMQPPGALGTNAQRALELAEIARHIRTAVQEEYVASMEFVAAQFPASTTLLKAYVNYRSTPYLPDIVAIVHQILVIDTEQRQAGCSPRELATAPAPPRPRPQEQLEEPMPDSAAQAAQEGEQ